MRSNEYLKSAAVTTRFTGGWNFTPLRRWMVMVLPSALMPPLATVGTWVARHGSSCVPAAPGLAT